MKTQALPRGLDFCRIILSVLIRDRMVPILCLLPSYIYLEEFLERLLGFGMGDSCAFVERSVYYGVYRPDRRGYAGWMWI